MWVYHTRILYLSACSKTPKDCGCQKSSVIYWSLHLLPFHTEKIDLPRDGFTMNSKDEKIDLPRDGFTMNSKDGALTWCEEIYWTGLHWIGWVMDLLGVIEGVVNFDGTDWNWWEWWWWLEDAIRGEMWSDKCAAFITRCLVKWTLQLNNS